MSRTDPATTGATRSTPPSYERSAGSRGTLSRTAFPRLLPGIATTASGGSRSSRASTSPTTAGSTRPACPRPQGLVLAAVLRSLDGVLGLVALRLELLRRFEVRHGFVALSKLKQGVAEVVVRVGLFRETDAAQLRHRLPE